MLEPVHDDVVAEDRRVSANGDGEKKPEFRGLVANIQPQELEKRSLAPKKLRARSDGGLGVRFVFMTLLFFFVLGSTVVYGILGYARAVNSIPQQSDTSCDRDVVTGAERAFMIDIRLGSFTFTKAKLIDITWDLFIGQGGRVLHAWILYRFVGADALVWVMEYSLVTYEHYMNMSFSPVSVFSLWSLMKMLRAKLVTRTFIYTLGMIFAIAHTLIFTTIWSAATGYISPSLRTYRMPDGTLVPINTPSLAPCWTIRDSRTGNDSNETLIVQGPSFDIIFAKSSYSGKFEDYETLWSRILDHSFANLDDEVYDNFRAIYAYAKMKSNLQYYLDFDQTSRSHYDTVLDRESMEETFNMTADENLKAQYISLESTPWKPARPPSGLPETLHGWTFGKSGRITKYDFEDSNRWIHTRYSLDPSITPGRGIVPYNSTFWYNKAEVEIDAPFLDVGSRCTHHDTPLSALGACVCYRGEPVRRDSTLLSPENIICVSEQGYVWGFSSILTLVGMILEVIWCFICWILWVDANANSELLRHRRRTDGLLRHVLDLAEAVNKELGPGCAEYSSQELEEELEKRDSVGYVVETLSNGTQNIRIRNVRGERRLMLVEEARET